MLLSLRSVISCDDFLFLISLPVHLRNGIHPHDPLPGYACVEGLRSVTDDYDPVVITAPR